MARKIFPFVREEPPLVFAGGGADGVGTLSSIFSYVLSPVERFPKPVLIPDPKPPQALVEAPEPKIAVKAAVCLLPRRQQNAIRQRFSNLDFEVDELEDDD